MRSTESLVEEEEPEFQVDLRIEAIAQDVILEDEESMGQIQKVVGKSRTGSRTDSNNEYLVKPEKSIKFSEESSRTIHRTVQCHSSLKHLPEGLIFCASVICLRPGDEQIQRTKARFQAMIVPYYLPRVITQEVKVKAKLNDKETIGEQWMLQKEQEEKVTTPL